MDRYCRWCGGDIFDSGSVHFSDPGEALPVLIKNSLEGHSDVEPINLREIVDAAPSRVVHIPTMGRVSFVSWRVRFGYLFAGIVLSFIIQIGLAALLTGP